MPQTSSAKSAERLGELENVFDALLDSFAIVEFDLDGKILTANENFLSVLGYSLKEVEGEHHRMFCDPEYAESAEYREFWRRLSSGETFTDEFPRRAKGDRPIWVQATYKPIPGPDGTPYKVIKVATDTTARRMQNATYEGKVRAISRSQAVIEFELDGTIVDANENFLSAVGYSADEVVGEHHRMFCDPEYAASAEYEAFWKSLRNGEFRSGEFKRFGNGGKEIWIQASYNPIFDADGNPVRVVKFASDITEAKLRNAKFEGQVRAISRSQAVIEFELDGTIVDANENFLDAIGYDRDEIVGQHHRMFCEPEYAASSEYRAFWKSLRAGEFQSGEYKRVASGGREIWIQATYNPILDADGNPIRVIKFATDVTAAKLQNAKFQGQVDAISRSQAVIEFELDGTIVDANENFLGAVGYTKSEIVGRHHRMFCDPEYVATPEYARMWDDLRQGQFLSGEFQRVGKDGNEIWIQATYNPLLDAEGRPFRVIKFASDVTSQYVERRERQEAEERERQRLEDQIERILATVTAAGQGDLSHRIETDADGAIGTLAAGINEMVGDLGALMEREEAAREVLEREIDRILAAVSKAGQGDLTHRIDTEAEGAIGALASGINQMMSDLREVVSRVVTSAGEFSGQTAEITGSAEQMSRRTESLGVTSEEMSANVEELTASINSIAKSSRDANELAKAASADAESGTVAVRESLEAMELINRSSNEIGEIVKVISEIASQTNLLAFNAAIEAARAGQHGRGFAVVADEVRKLAERSSDATKEISKLIQESTSRIQKGSHVSENAAKSFREIAKRVETTYAAINQIATGAEEQSSAAREVNVGVQSVSSEAEKSAHSCDVIARTCSGLAAQARSMQELVERFTV